MNKWISAWQVRLRRHSRAGGKPVFFRTSRNVLLGSRLRGDDRSFYLACVQQHAGAGRHVWMVLLLLLSGPGMAAETGGSRVDQSLWQASTEADSCVLTHAIPGYGEARFRVGRTLPLQFEVQSQRSMAQGGLGRVYAVAPEWREPMEQELGHFRYAGGRQPAVVSGVQAREFLEAINRGLALHLFLLAPEGGILNEVDVSPVSFWQAREDWRDCQMRQRQPEVVPAPTQLAQASGKAGQDTHPADLTVLFAQGSAELDAEARAELDAHLGQLVQGRALIVIDGFASWEGASEQNQELSRLRTAAVQEYLRQKGMPEERLSARWHGEPAPVIKGLDDTPEGMLRDRRVVIRY